MILLLSAILSSFFVTKLPALSYFLGFCLSLVFPSLDKSLLETLAIIAVIASVPCFLISCNWKQLKSLTKEVSLSFALLIVSVLCVSFAVTIKAENGSILGGMAVALYTGGTLNLNAVATYFHLDSQTLFFANLSDMLFGGIFYAFLLTLAKPLMGKFLTGKTEECKIDYHSNKLESTGRYLCCVFNFCIAAMVDIRKIKLIPINLFLIFALITLGSFILHAILCRIFKISVDVMLLTSTAGIYGPAFIPGVAKSIKAESLIAPGLLVGSLGYALGTFLGIGTAYLIRLV